MVGFLGDQHPYGIRTDKTGDGGQNEHVGGWIDFEAKIPGFYIDTLLTTSPVVISHR